MLAVVAPVSGRPGGAGPRIKSGVTKGNVAPYPGHPGLDPGSRLSFLSLMEHRGGWVYIMADRYRGAIYVGVTADLAARIHQHRTGAGSDFCKRYGLDRLVWAEQAGSISEAITQEKRVKRWRRAWKFALIERGNPEWRNLFEMIL